MKCYCCMFDCRGTARNILSFCGPCNQAKRKLGQVVVNKGSPHNTATSVALKKQKTERSESEQRLCDRHALQFMSQCILTLRAPSSSARCLLCACFNMRNADMRICDCKPPLHSLTIFVCPYQLPDPQQDPERRCGRDTPQIHNLSKQETNYTTGYSYQTPCSILARALSLVRQLEHAHL